MARPCPRAACGVDRMSSRKRFIVVAALAALLGSAPARAENEPLPLPPGTPPEIAAGKFKYPIVRKVNNKPLPEGVKATSTMAPFAAGDCGFCHQRNDRKDPGPVKKLGNAL